jgi:hypothetical protein
MRTRILTSFLFVIALSVMALAPALAGDDVLAFTEGETEVEETEAPMESELGIEPAVEAPAEVEEEEEQPWTQRYLAPTVAVLGLGGLIGAVAYYGIRIRSRYEVVED